MARATARNPARAMARDPATGRGHVMAVVHRPVMDSGRGKLNQAPVMVAAENTGAVHATFPVLSRVPAQDAVRPGWAMVTSVVMVQVTDVVTATVTSSVRATVRIQRTGVARASAAAQEWVWVASPVVRVTGTLVAIAVAGKGLEKGCYTGVPQAIGGADLRDTEVA